MEIHRRGHSYPEAESKSSRMPRHSTTQRRGRGATPENFQIVPVILAAGRAPRLGFPQALARFGRRTALEIAVENCAGLARPIVVLGHRASRVRAAVPPGARAVVHAGWRSGQLGSLRAGLRRVPRGVAFMLYPVDYPLLTPAVVRRLVSGFRRKATQHAIVVPVFGRRGGHPVIFSPEVRGDLSKARSAREVVEREPRRVKFVPVKTAAIWEDFDTRASYLRCRRAYLRQER